MKHNNKYKIKHIFLFLFSIKSKYNIIKNIQNTKGFLILVIPLLKLIDNINKHETNIIEVLLLLILLENLYITKKITEYNIKQVIAAKNPLLFKREIK